MLETYPNRQKLCQLDGTDILRTNKHLSALADLGFRFWSKVDTSGDCWEWIASCNKYGYGQFFWNGRPRKAHRVAYEAVNGPIPHGLEIDHLCKVRHCVNPAHLEPVTHRENLLRGDTFQAANAAKTHCPLGHPYDVANTFYQPSGGRRCRECDRSKSREYQRAKARTKKAAALTAAATH